jgi:hypothetical protein
VEAFWKHLALRLPIARRELDPDGRPSSQHRRRETLTVTGWSPATRDSRRLDMFFVARRDAAGTLRPAGAVQLGLAVEERDRLRAAI